MDFSWLSNIFESILQFIPRPIIIRATHEGVCWTLGYRVKRMKPGWRWIWPIIQDYELLAVARQPNNIPNQALITKDHKQVAVAAMIIFSIKDIVQAIGQKNWDVTSTVEDIAAAAVVRVITKHTLDELLDGLTDKIQKELTQNCQQQLRQFGVYVHRASFTDFSTCKVYKIMGTNPVQEAVEE